MYHWIIHSLVNNFHLASNIINKATRHDIDTKMFWDQNSDFFSINFIDFNIIFVKASVTIWLHDLPQCAVLDNDYTYAIIIKL